MAHGNVFTRLSQKGRHKSIKARCHFHGALVSLNFKQDIIRPDGLTGLFEPIDQKPRILCHSKCWHNNRLALWKHIILRDLLRRHRVRCLRDHRNDLPHRDLVTCIGHNIGQKPRMLCIHLHRRLVGFNFKKRITHGYRIPRLFGPTDKNAAILRHTERWHYHIM